MPPADTLPPPSPEAAAHSQQLAEHIASTIVAEGDWIPFSRYMDLALHAPGLGYYAAGSRKFGGEGDFVTAPEITPFFARCIALQARQVLEATGGELLELGMILTEGGFAWDDEPLADGELKRRAASVFPPGEFDYLSEVNFAAEGLVRTIAGSIEAGLALFIDYGFPEREYYHAQRAMGTLRCHYRHRVHGNPFFWPGLEDITAHVDFTAMARAAESAEAEVVGFTTQA